MEVRQAREFQAPQGKSFLLDLPVLNEEYSQDDTGSNADDATDVHFGRGGQNASGFMRLRDKRIKRSQASSFISQLRLGGSFNIDSNLTLANVACLFSYMTRRMAPGGLAGEPERLDVVSIEMISL